MHTELTIRDGKLYIINTYEEDAENLEKSYDRAVVSLDELGEYIGRALLLKGYDLNTCYRTRASIRYL